MLSWLDFGESRCTLGILNNIYLNRINVMSSSVKYVESFLYS